MAHRRLPPGRWAAYRLAEIACSACFGGQSLGRPGRRRRPDL